MAPWTSPNDPIFFLHHCFVDFIWDKWIRQNKEENPEFQAYLPVKGVAGVVGLKDFMPPWNGKDYLFRTQEDVSAAAPRALLMSPGDVLNTADLGYVYDKYE